MVHFDYLQHVFDVFKSAAHVNMAAPCHGTSTINGVVHKWSKFYTVFLSSWIELQTQWYVNGVKVIFSNIQEVLTPIKLAYLAGFLSPKKDISFPVFFSVFFLQKKKKTDNRKKKTRGKIQLDDGGWTK